jgi:hypothetical protein
MAVLYLVAQSHRRHLVHDGVPEFVVCRRACKIFRLSYCVPAMRSSKFPREVRTIAIRCGQSRPLSVERGIDAGPRAKLRSLVSSF